MQHSRGEGRCSTVASRLLLCFVLLLFAACRSSVPAPSVPSVPPSASSAPTTAIFGCGLPARDISNGGGTTVQDFCDQQFSLDSPALAYGIVPGLYQHVYVRHTISLNYSFQNIPAETWSVYAWDATRTCIANVQEETRAKSDHALIAIQQYHDKQNLAPCWINGATVTTGVPDLTNSIVWVWTWRHFDPGTGVQIGTEANGLLDDGTRLSLSGTTLTLIERYEDVSTGVPGSVYCGRGAYRIGSGMQSISQDPGACTGI